MIKVQVTQDFPLKDFNKIKNLERARIDIKGKLFVGDKFECDEQMCKYLMGDNKYNMSVVKIVEVKPYEAKVFDTDKVEVKTDKPKKKKTSKK